MKSTAPPVTDTFLPDFCAPHLVFKAILLGLALATVLVLSPLGRPGYRWDEWVLAGFFVIWIVVSNVALLCVLRRQLLKLRETLALALAYLITLGVTWLFSELAWQRVIAPLSAEDALSSMQHYVFIARNLGISAILHAVWLHYLHVAHHHREQALAAVQARLQALQSRMQPHFLFNAMNTIAGLTRVDPGLAEEAVEDLAELFRAGLADARELISLGEELALCRHYLHIESLRLGERLHVEWDLNLLPENAPVPALSLQTLLENAVRHGIQSLPEGGTIKVSGLCDGRHIKIDIENPLSAAKPARRGHHIAHANLRQRLQAYYGRRGYLETTRQDGVYRVRLRFPTECRARES